MNKNKCLIKIKLTTKLDPTSGGSTGSQIILRKKKKDRGRGKKNDGTVPWYSNESKLEQNKGLPK